MVGILLLTKRIFKKSLTSRMQYNLWFILLGLLTIPFIQIKSVVFFPLFSLIENCKNISFFQNQPMSNSVVPLNPSYTTNWMNDFALSVSKETPYTAGLILFAVWIIGIFAMLIFAFKSIIQLNTLLKTALPLQNIEVRQIFNNCLSEMKITRKIPIYSTAFINSPIFVGFFKPRIYFPIHSISDYNAKDIRYMLLHELQHYKHKDALANYLMNVAGIMYWFNPFIWYALKEMRNDREVACDSSVLKMLKEENYVDYGNTLINLAEKVSLTPFPFVTRISGNMKQIKQRIVNIAFYQKPSLRKNVKSSIAFLLTCILLLGFAPLLSTYAEDNSRYQWNASSENILYTDFSSYFDKYDGSFVLYDSAKDLWNIYNAENATTRISPNSTFKIYSALFGLEEGVITPKQNLITWNGDIYPFEDWNINHNLFSAMDASVNWYFQTIDNQLGKSKLQHYVHKIDYGNKDISGNLSSYWIESSLKISPLEQVELLRNLYSNNFGFSQENINILKESICLFSSETGSFYGKTGTGRVNGQDINGWFVGFVENAGQTYFFAVNIQGDADATGSNAVQIALSILSDINVWETTKTTLN